MTKINKYENDYLKQKSIFELASIDLKSKDTNKNFIIEQLNLLSIKVEKKISTIKVIEGTSTKETEQLLINFNTLSKNIKDLVSDVEPTITSVLPLSNPVIKKHHSEIQHVENNKFSTVVSYYSPFLHICKDFESLKGKVNGVNSNKATIQSNLEDLLERISIILADLEKDLAESRLTQMQLFAISSLKNKLTVLQTDTSRLKDAVSKKIEGNQNLPEYLRDDEFPVALVQSCGSETDKELGTSKTLDRLDGFYFDTNFLVEESFFAHSALSESDKLILEMNEKYLNFINKKLKFIWNNYKKLIRTPENNFSKNLNSPEEIKKFLSCLYNLVEMVIREKTSFSSGSLNRAKDPSHDLRKRLSGLLISHKRFREELTPSLDVLQNNFFDQSEEFFMAIIELDEWIVRIQDLLNKK